MWVITSFLSLMTKGFCQSRCPWFPGSSWSIFHHPSRLKQLSDFLSEQLRDVIRSALMKWDDSELSHPEWFSPPFLFYYPCPLHLIPSFTFQNKLPRYGPQFLGSFFKESRLRLLLSTVILGRRLSGLDFKAGSLTKHMTVRIPLLVVSGVVIMLGK